MAVLISVASLLLGIPSALLAYTDYKQRKQLLSATQPAGGVAPVPAAPVPVPVSATIGSSSIHPGPIVRPSAALHFRTTVDLAEPLSFPRRLLAGLVDTYGGLLVAGVLTGMIVDPVYGTEDDFNATFGVLWLVWLVAVAAMNAHGRSPGKYLTGGTLVRHTNRGESVSFWRSLGRLTLALFVPFSFWFVLGKGRRTAHDRLTDTVVVRMR